MSKYKNIKTTIDGITFASKREATRYSELKLLEKAKAITNLRLQVAYVLTQALDGEYRKERAMTYVADFVYEANGVTFVEDSKGKRTQEYINKRKMMLAVHGISIYET